MKRKVNVTPAAEADINRLADFLADRDADLALVVTDLLSSAIASLKEFGDRGAPGLIPGRRELIAPFGRSAYVIQYRVYERSVLIVRIFHSLEDRPLA